MHAIQHGGKKTHREGKKINGLALLSFAVRGMFFTPGAMLSKLQAIFERALILARKMRGVLAFGTLHFYQIVLGHRKIKI